MVERHARAASYSPSARSTSASADPQVAGRVEQRVRLVGREPVRSSARSASRNERALAASATTSCAGHGPGVGEGERDALCDDEAAARLEVRPHPAGVDLEAGDGVRGGGRRSSGERERAGERLPLRVPAAHRPLVLVGEPAEQDSRMGVREACARDRERRADRIALLRHRRRPSARRLGKLAHLALRGGRCRQRPSRPRPRLRPAPRRARDALAVRVPRAGAPRAELLCVATDDLERVVSEGGERARGAAELRREAPPAPSRASDAPRAPTRASLPPSARKSWAPPAGGACARPSVER